MKILRGTIDRMTPTVKGQVDYMDAQPLHFAGPQKAKPKQQSVDPVNFSIDLVNTNDPNYIAFSVGDWEKILTALEMAGVNIRHVQQVPVPVVAIYNNVVHGIKEIEK